MVGLLSVASIGDFDEASHFILSDQAQFEESENPGKYRIVQGQNTLAILPRYKSLLETSITIDVREVPAAKALEATLAKMRQASGQKMEFWRLPLNTLKKPVTVSMHGRPAYEIVGRILIGADERLSAQFIYDANVNSYLVTVYHAF